VAAAGYLPSRDRLLASATRFVYGAREAPDEALRTFGSRMTRAVAMDELLLQLAESLRKTMRLDCAEIYTGAGDVLERAVSVPDASSKSIVLTDRERPVVARAGVSGSAWASIWLPALLDGREQAQLRVAPISHAGELLGLIVVERAARADAFTEEDDRVLTELARQAALAFHNSQLDSALQTTLNALRKQADELRESRARIVASGDAERRRVERDLHDGAQQQIVALMAKLRLARNQLVRDPAIAGQTLAEAQAEAQQTLQDLRELARGIHPSVLSDQGILAAVRSRIGRLPIGVRLTAGPELAGARYPDDIEGAAYFLVCEALVNVVKHAHASQAQVMLSDDGATLHVEIIDDGTGFDPAEAAGSGLTGLTDRIEAVGGSLSIRSRPESGTWLVCELPVRGRRLAGV
jgi:signal transduction histidine kinase